MHENGKRMSAIASLKNLRNKVAFKRFLRKEGKSIILSIRAGAEPESLLPRLADTLNGGLVKYNLTAAEGRKMMAKETQRLLKGHEQNIS